MPTTTDIGGGVLFDSDSVNSGTGQYDSFLRVQNTGTEDGFNTNDTPPLNDKGGVWTHAIQISELQVVTIGGIDYYEFRLDLNETNSKTGPQIELTNLNFYISPNGAVDGDYNGSGGFTGFTSVYSLATPLALVDTSNGSGTDDGGFLVPVSMFASAGATSSSYLTLYSRFTGADGGFEEFRAVTNTTVPVTPQADIVVSKTYTTTPGDITDPSGANGVIDHAGQVVNYTIQFQNTGNVGINNIDVTDDLPGATAPVAVLGADAIHNVGDANNNGILDPGEIWTYTSSYTATQGDIDAGGGNTVDGVSVVGDLTNGATVTGTPIAIPALPPVSGQAFAETPIDQDPSVEIQKLVSVDGGQTWQDANSATGPTLLAGFDAPQYEFIVTNNGDVTLTNLTVHDDTGLDLNGGAAGFDALIASLAPGAANAITIPATGTWAAGQQHDTGSVTGSYTDALGATTPLNASDPAYYFGLAPSLNVEKLVSVDGGTNWFFLADDAADTVAAIATLSGIAAANLHIGTPTTLGGNVEYEFVVTNTGNVNLTGVNLADDTYDVSAVGVIGSLAAGASVLTGPVTEAWSLNTTTDTVTATSDKVTDDAGNSVTPKDTDQAAVTGIAASINVEKLVSVDGGTNWYFLADDASDTIAAIAALSGIAAANLHIGVPTTTAGLNVQFEFVVQNTGTVDLTGVTLSDNVYGADANTAIGALAVGQIVTKTITEVAQFGVNLTDIATVGANTITDSANHSVTPSDTDSAAYTGNFIEGTPGLTIGYWYNHHTDKQGHLLWNEATFDTGTKDSHGNEIYVKGVLLGDSTGTVWSAHSTAATALTLTNFTAGHDAAGMLFVPDAAAAELINSSQSANDTRQTLMSQALAAQLNIDAGDKDPGLGGVPGHDLIGEAVQWLTGKSPFIFADGSTGNVDSNHDGVLQTGAGAGFEYNTTSHSLTADGNGAIAGTALTSNLQAWQFYHVFATGYGNVSADGEGLKNALQAFNQNHLVTNTTGTVVAWDESGAVGGPYSLFAVNGPDDFWWVLHKAAALNATDAGLLHGII